MCEFHGTVKNKQSASQRIISQRRFDYGKYSKQNRKQDYIKEI